MSFEKSYKFGKISESFIADYFRKRGHAILPIYEKEISEGKGPQIFFPDNEEIIGTDMLVINLREKNTLWVEAKHKTAFSWHRISNKWVTGIDLRHYEHYLKFREKTSWPLWLIFHHEGGQAKDSPAISPKGLFGNDIDFLKQNENHRHNGWGKSGMVYWAIDKLKLLSTD